MQQLLDLLVTPARLQSKYWRSCSWTDALRCRLDSKRSIDFQRKAAADKVRLGLIRVLLSYRAMWRLAFLVRTAMDRPPRCNVDCW